MIAFYAQGGLGNQLFQYAAARRVAEKFGVEVVLDPYWFSHPRPGETQRQPELGKYNVKLRVGSAQEQRAWKWRRGRLGRLIARFAAGEEVVREQGFAYNESVERAPDNSYLIGFWQSERYFSDIREVLLNELQPIAAPSERDSEIMSAMSACNAICVHVRRGDYVSLNSAATYHGVCSLDYYARAIKYITQQTDNPTLFIFSDDPDWTRENLVTDDCPVQYVNHNSAGDAFQDLRMMSRCKHHIIANSSFSWWGAWLSTHPDQIVIAPEQWFLAGRPTPDLLPSTWIRL